MLSILSIFIVLPFWVPVEALSLPHPSKLLSRQVDPGFQLVETNSLKAFNLGASCEQVLYQTIKCDPFVTTLKAKVRS